MLIQTIILVYFLGSPFPLAIETLGYRHSSMTSCMHLVTSTLSELMTSEQIALMDNLEYECYDVTESI